MSLTTRRKGSMLPFLQLNLNYKLNYVLYYNTIQLLPYLLAGYNTVYSTTTLLHFITKTSLKRTPHPLSPFRNLKIIPENRSHTFPDVNSQHSNITTAPWEYLHVCFVSRLALFKTHYLAKTKRKASTKSKTYEK